MIDPNGGPDDCTVRGYFAVMILQGMLAHDASGRASRTDQKLEDSLELADQLINNLNETLSKHSGMYMREAYTDELERVYEILAEKDERHVATFYDLTDAHKYLELIREN